MVGVCHENVMGFPWRVIWGFVFLFWLLQEDGMRIGLTGEEGFCGDQSPGQRMSGGERGPVILAGTSADSEDLARLSGGGM